MRYLFILLQFLFVNSIKIPYKPKIVDGPYLMAKELIENDSHEFDLILNYLKKSNCAEAKTLLGDYYLFGVNGERDIQRSFNYFKQAYNQGSAEAGFYLYVVLLQSNFFNIKDVETTFESERILKSLYRTSVSRGSILMKTHAILNYFRCKTKFFTYFNEKKKFNDFYCNHDVEEIANFALEVAEQAISKIIRQGRGYIIPLPFDTDILYLHETHKLLLLAKKSFEDINKKSLSILAENYVFGNPELGISRNISQSIELFEQAANSGSIKAHDSLAVIYLHGLDIPANYSKAIDHLIEAVRLGSVRSINGIAYALLNSLNISNDQETAIKYYELAAESGDIEALNNIALIYIKKQQERSLGIEYLKMSAEAGYLPALYNLGLLYFEGTIVNKSYTEAIKNF